MLTHYLKTLVSTVSVCVLFGVSSPARAQYGFDGAPGYPYAGQQGYGAFGGFGWSGYGSNPEGLSGFGSVGYGFGGSSGNFSGAQFGTSFQQNVSPCGLGCSAGAPHTQLSFQPTLDMVTAVPGWNSTSHRTRRRTAPRPSARITPPIDGTGKNASPDALAKNPNITPIR